jgi:hypothetical protein
MGGAGRVDDPVAAAIRSCRATPGVSAGRRRRPATVAASPVADLTGTTVLVLRPVSQWPVLVDGVVELIGAGTVRETSPIEQGAPPWRRFGAIRCLRAIHALTSCRSATAKARGDQGTVSNRLLGRLVPAVRRAATRLIRARWPRARRDDRCDRCAGSARHRSPLFHIGARMPSRFGLCQPACDVLHDPATGSPSERVSVVVRAPTAAGTRCRSARAPPA